MNGIYGMELQYESLIPIARPKDTFLSVGTVTFLTEGKELPLDFNITESGTEGNAGSIIRLNALVKDFEPQVFMDEYRAGMAGHRTGTGDGKPKEARGEGSDLLHGLPGTRKRREQPVAGQLLPGSGILHPALYP